MFKGVNMTHKSIAKQIIISLGVAGALFVGALGQSAPASATALSPTSTLKAGSMRSGVSLSYVALGDSVAAGLGLPPAAGAGAEDMACGRSSQAYSSDVAAGIRGVLAGTPLHVSDQNIACQGAVTDNLTTPQVVGGVTVPSQLDQAFAHGTPALLTLTVGVNDVHWSNFLQACFSASSCDTAANTAAANAYVASMQTKLSSALAGIQTRSGFIPPFVIVTGYYHPVSMQCVNANLTPGEVTWLDQETDRLNNALRTASQQQAGWFTRFAPVDFTGHDICSADPWLQRPGVPGEPAAFHPNAQGQRVIAQDVLKQLGL
jgi:lysophospholipase L1-like esterase